MNRATPTTDVIEINSDDDEVICCGSTTRRPNKRPRQYDEPQEIIEIETSDDDDDRVVHVVSRHAPPPATARKRDPPHRPPPPPQQQRRVVHRHTAPSFMVTAAGATGTNHIHHHHRPTIQPPPRRRPAPITVSRYAAVRTVPNDVRPVKPSRHHAHTVSHAHHHHHHHHQRNHHHPAKHSNSPVHPPQQQFATIRTTTTTTRPRSILKPGKFLASSTVVVDLTTTTTRPTPVPPPPLTTTTCPTTTTKQEDRTVSDTPTVPQHFHETHPPPSPPPVYTRDHQEFLFVSSSSSSSCVPQPPEPTGTRSPPEASNNDDRDIQHPTTRLVANPSTTYTDHEISSSSSAAGHLECKLPPDDPPPLDAGGPTHVAPEPDVPNVASRSVSPRHVWPPYSPVVDTIPVVVHSSSGRPAHHNDTVVAADPTWNVIAMPLDDDDHHDRHHHDRHDHREEPDEKASTRPLTPIPRPPLSHDDRLLSNIIDTTDPHVSQAPTSWDVIAMRMDDDDDYPEQPDEKASARPFTFVPILSLPPPPHNIRSGIETTDHVSKSPTRVSLDDNPLLNSKSECTSQPILNNVAMNDGDDIPRVAAVDDDSAVRTAASLDNSSVDTSSEHLAVAPTTDSYYAPRPISKKKTTTTTTTPPVHVENTVTTCPSPLSSMLVVDEDPELPASMVSVPHWSRKRIDPITHLPVWEFSVYGEDDAILYSFRAFAAKSKLPGAGMGAFLEFVGAKRLYQWSDQRRLRLIHQLDPYEAETMRPLQAYPKKGGSGVTVHLKGNDLHGNGNREFKLKELRAIVLKGCLRKKSFSKKKYEELTVNLISEEDLQLNIEYDANYISEGSLLKPIGHFKVQTDCDYYVDHWTTQFKSKLNCIDLGRYGPFQKSDRKIEDFFVLKSFIFSNVPAEWSFGALEMLCGMPQIIDITDDVTGHPSDFAQKEIPMYVNEVGYNKDFVQNVYIKDSDDERSIQYYFMPNTPMEIGVPVELLTNYKTAYESVRERKGYGLSNLQQGLKSDSCRATRLQRNFLEREDVESIIAECASTRTRPLLQSVDNRIFSPLVELLRNGQQLTTLQWVALNRIHWIVDVFRKKSRGEKCKEKIIEMDEKFANEVLPIFRRNSSNSTQQNFINEQMKSGIYFELLEEICFPLRLELPQILDTAIYCPAAVQLTESLCHSIADIYILRKPGQSDKAVSKMYAKFIEFSLRANTEITSGGHQSNDVQLTQIVKIIVVFASVYFQNSSYSMQTICKSIGLDFTYVKAAQSAQKSVSGRVAAAVKKPCARKDGKQTRPPFTYADQVYSGPPTIPFPVDKDGQWPDGWTQKSYRRTSGATIGRIDDYWFPPAGLPKLRSRVDIRKYFEQQAKLQQTKK